MVPRARLAKLASMQAVLDHLRAILALQEASPIRSQKEERLLVQLAQTANTQTLPKSRALLVCPALILSSARRQIC